MKLKSFVLLAALIFAVSSVSAQDGGAPDSLKLVPVTTLETGLSTQTFEIVCSAFVDSATLSTLQFGWDWTTVSATLVMDSAFPSAAFDAFEIGPFFFLANVLQTTNDSQIAIASGTSIFTNFPVSASWQHVCTYYMTMTNWTGASSLIIDTVQNEDLASTDYIFLPLLGFDYDPIWGGPIIITGTAVDESITDILPTFFQLEQNYPNPFNPATSIWFDLPTRAKVTLTVFNLLGQEVSTLVDEDLPAGRHLSIWDGHANNGAAVASGIYFYKLIADTDDKKFVETKKMMLLK